MNHDDYGQIDVGGRAAMAKAAVTQRLAEQEATLTTETLTKFRAGLLTTEGARDFVAQLSALRELTYALDKDVRKAGDARARMLSTRRPA